MVTAKKQMKQSELCNVFLQAEIKFIMVLRDSVKSSIFMLKCDEVIAWFKTFHYATIEIGCLDDYKSPWKHTVMQNP